jgi:hypothetical protein
MILITTFYIPNNKEREKEINKCLQKNYENPLIKNIYLLNDKIYELPLDLTLYNNKIIQITLNNITTNTKLRFDDAINFINNCQECIGKLCILSNSDIYFDETLSNVNQSTISNNVFALLRYDESLEGFHSLYSENGIPRLNSQDCWIFKSPLKVDTKLLDFEFGTLGCDNTFAYVIHKSGIYISNPCYSIKTIHLHSSQFRTYNNIWLCRDYCYLVPCKLGEMPDVLYTDCWGNPIKDTGKIKIVYNV